MKSGPLDELITLRCHPGSCLRSRTFLWWGMVIRSTGKVHNPTGIWFRFIFLGRYMSLTVVAFPENNGVGMVLVGDMFQLIVFLQNPCGCRSPGSAKLLNDEGLYTADALSSAKWVSFIARGGGSGKEGVRLGLFVFDCIYVRNVSCPKIDLVGVLARTVMRQLHKIAICYDIVSQMNVQQVVCNMVEKIL